MNIWMLAGLAAAVYCIVRGVVDLRQRRFAWGALGLLAGVLLLSIPVQTHAVKFDLPAPADPQS